MNRAIIAIILTLICQATPYSIEAKPVAMLPSSTVHGYIPPDPQQPADTTQKEKDMIDVIRDIRNKEPDTTKKIKTGKILYSLVPAAGYTLSTGWTGSLNANLAFYTSNPEKTRISSITTSIIASQYKQITIPVQANIWTRDNNYDFIVDWRYFKYPQNTYGLGPNTSLSDEDNIDYSHIRLHQTALKNVGKALFVGLGYFYDRRWKIIEKGTNEGVSAYGLTRNSISSGPVASLLYDNRVNSINPLEGFYLNAQFRPNMKILGSNSNWQSLTIDVRKYFNLPRGSQNTLGFWNYNWLTISGKPPYLDLPSTGWDPTNNIGRGYIQGRYRSPNLLYLESEYRFAITPNGLLGAVVFANAQSVSKWPSGGFSKISPAAGLGIRIKVNKTSRTNIAIDYGFGADGSHGLFVNLGEVF